MDIYLIRHGQSKANELDLFLGQGDLDLTGRGYEQARATAKYLSTLPVDAIYSSDLMRALHTAEETQKLIKLPIIKDEGLREINCGEWEFMPFKEIVTKYEKSYSLWLTDIGSARCDGGESVMEVQERIVKTVRRIADESLGKTLLIFSHATAIRCFAGYCKGEGAENISSTPWPNNASVTRVKYEEGKFTLVSYGYDEFLGQMRTGFNGEV